MAKDRIVIKGAREHNLKGIDVEIRGPRQFEELLLGRDRAAFLHQLRGLPDLAVQRRRGQLLGLVRIPGERAVGGGAEEPRSGPARPGDADRGPW